MTSEDLVFEFFVKSISCRNVKSKSSPLVIEINGCDVDIYASNGSFSFEFDNEKDSQKFVRKFKQTIKKH